MEMNGRDSNALEPRCYDVEPDVEVLKTPFSKPWALDWAGHLVFAFVLFVLFIIGLARGSDALCLFLGVLLIFFVVGELVYSRFLADKIFLLSNTEVTPANEPGHEGDPDYCATPAFILWGHHWTSITGAAPIIGQAQAAFYGWLPAMIWVVLGCLFSGAVHDMSTLIVSSRNGGRSIADLGGTIINWRVRVLFLLLINFLCMLVVAKFMEVIAKLFIAWPATVPTVWLEIPLAVGLGFAAKYMTPRFGEAKTKVAVMALSLAILLMLYGIMAAAIAVEDAHGVWVDGTNVDPVFGWTIAQSENDNHICRDSVNWVRGQTRAGPNGTTIQLTEDEHTCAFGAMQFWTVFLCLYAMVAACLPVWVLLQPRDFINSHQLKCVMFFLLLALVVKCPTLDADAVRSDLGNVEDRNPVFPMMFTLVACGATSGFHGLVSSGVTSKQVKHMRDTRPVGYTAMMGESTLSALVIVIVCSAGTWKATYSTGMNWTGFLSAGGTLLESLGFGSKFARTAMDVLVVSFAATTLDSGMRIQRILVGELGKQMESNQHSDSYCYLFGRLFQKMGTQICISALPSLWLANSRSIGSVWNLFGATNQLVACVSLIIVAVYVFRFRKFEVKWAMPFIVLIAWLLIMISWALINVISGYIEDCEDKGCDWSTTVPTYTTVILAFIILLFVAAIYAKIALYLYQKKYLEDDGIDENGKLNACKKCDGDRSGNDPSSATNPNWLRCCC